MTTPVRSMTGAATFAVDSPLGRLEAEARSVNHRFLKTSVRTQGPLPAAATRAESAVKQRQARGHVSIHVRLRPPTNDTSEVRIDAVAFAAAAARLRALCEAQGIHEIRARDVLGVPGVLGETRSEQDEAVLVTALGAVLDGVAAALADSRAREGALMVAEVERLLDEIARAGSALAERAGEVPAAFQERLRKRLGDLLEGTGVQPDEAQLAREVAALADRSDVREEIARIDAHLTHARELLAAGGAVGRKLDFLVQELHREANTVGSKSGDLALSRVVLDLKSAIERLREQAANLE